jgi:hypothetical protein
MLAKCPILREITHKCRENLRQKKGQFSMLAECLLLEEITHIYIYIIIVQQVF